MTSMVGRSIQDLCFHFPMLHHVSPPYITAIVQQGLSSDDLKIKVLFLSVLVIQKIYREQYNLKMVYSTIDISLLESFAQR